MREVKIPGIGNVKMYKRRGMRNIRVSIRSDGSVRISLPNWSSYLAAERFAKKQAEWIKQHQMQTELAVINHGDRIGQTAVIEFERSASTRTSARVSPTKISIRSNLEFNSPQFQSKALAAAEKSLRLQAESTFPERVRMLATLHGFKYKDVKVKKLTSRWGSCSPQGLISLSFYLVQLPQELIDYVMIHELTHTQHLNHAKSFWSRLEQILPDAKKLRRQMRAYRPALKPYRLPSEPASDNIDLEDLPLG